MTPGNINSKYLPAEFKTKTGNMTNCIATLSPLFLALLLTFSACTNQSGDVSSTTAPEEPAASAEDVYETDSDTYFMVSGAEELTVDPGTATLSQWVRGIWGLNITFPDSARDGNTNGANLFFSRDFTPEPGTYEIRYDYFHSPGSLGASYIGDRRFAEGAEGEATFSDTGGHFKVSFRFKSFDRSRRHAVRDSVIVVGSALVDRESIEV